ncbi:thiaminase II [Chryseomicrobium palamuruense]|uniref:Aminopyrimidine aminohydrolase n=1 Tax=Chryseomicrobium palamuruense TaxID=682973 RepID=A0ABV8US50_9BACL
MGISKEMRKENEKLWESSFHHPFVKGLADGTLPKEVFKFYVLQDAYYLSHFAKVQAIAASKATDLKMTQAFAHHAEQTCVAELQLHQTFVQELGITEQEVKDFKPSPSAYGYITHLYYAAQGDIADILAALLPCYWLYYEIGTRFSEAKPEDPIYQKWLETYNSEWFAALVNEQIDRMDELADGKTEEQKNRLKELFRISSYYEWTFWQQAWDQQTWDVEGGVLDASVPS